MPSVRITVSVRLEDVEKLFWAANSGELESLGIVSADYADQCMQPAQPLVEPTLCCASCGQPVDRVEGMVNLNDRGLCGCCASIDR